MQTGLTLVVRNARIIDGTGSPGYLGDVGVSNDRISVLGRVQNPSANARVIDAGGKVLAPGFIDVHTHYDAHIAWDKTLSPSPLTGVTSLVMGNCSLGMAPMRKEGIDYLMGLFEVVEDIPAAMIKQQIQFSWTSFPEYLAQLRPGLGPNVGVLLGHAMLRDFVMGADCNKRAATDTEIAQMADLVREAMNAGALGLSINFLHKDAGGIKLPTMWAEEKELFALCRAMMSTGRGMLEVVIPAFSLTEEEEVIGLMGRLSLETGTAVSLDGYLFVPQRGIEWLNKEVELLEEWRARGARMTAQAIARPFDMTFNLSQNTIGFSKLPSWEDIMLQPVQKRIERLSDPVARKKMAQEAEERLDYLPLATVCQVNSADNERYLGRSLREIAEEKGMSCVNAMLELALPEGLDMSFSVRNVIHADDDKVVPLLDHPLINIGAGDAGAHVSQFPGAGDTCYMFEHFVRESKRMTVERAVQRLTSELARDWNIEHRGTIESGNYADLVIFDPQTIARGEEKSVRDYPNQMARWVRRPEGIDQVIVNGQILVEAGAMSEARPGRLI